MNSVAIIVNLCGTLVGGLCAVLLLLAYHRVRRRLLLWSGLCFAGLTVSNAVMVIDLLLLPEQINLYPWRLAIAAVAMLTLVYGLVWESE